MKYLGYGGSKTLAQSSHCMISQIADATDNFSTENKLGEGGFGPIYKVFPCYYYGHAPIS